MQELTLIESGAQTATFNSREFEMGADVKGAKFFLDITAVSGTTPTLVLKLQDKDPASGKWVDVSLATFASKNATGTDTMEIYPGITALVSRRANGVVGKTCRLVGIIGGTTPSFTLSVGAVLLK